MRLKHSRSRPAVRGEDTGGRLKVKEEFEGGVLWGEEEEGGREMKAGGRAKSCQGSMARRRRRDERRGFLEAIAQGAEEN